VGKRSKRSHPWKGDSEGGRGKCYDCVFSACYSPFPPLFVDSPSPICIQLNLPVLKAHSYVNSRDKTALFLPRRLTYVGRRLKRLLRLCGGGGKAAIGEGMRLGTWEQVK